MLQRLLIIAAAAALWTGHTASQDALSSEVLRLINEARAAANVPPVFWNEQLAAAALDHSLDMAQQERLSHVGSDGSQFWERAARSGYVMITGAQNVLARSDLSALNAVRQWQQNDANNANLLDPNYQEIGFAFARSQNRTVYYTLLLGQRADFQTPEPTLEITIVPSAVPTAAASSALNESTEVLETALPTATLDPLVLTLIAPMPTATLDPRLSVTPPARPMTTFTPLPPPMGLRLFISRETVTIQALGDEDVDISGVVLASERGRLPIARFDNGFLTAPLTAFPPMDCLQVWTETVSQVLPRPAPCSVRHSWIVTSQSAAFWLDVPSFRVERDGAVIGICSVSADVPTVCDVSLTGAAVSVPTSTPVMPSSAVINAGVVRLLISPEGVTLQNLTGNSLDVSNFVFVGNSARFEASAWRTPELSRPLEAIPGGDCLQIWASGISSLPKPETCRFRHGWVVVSASRQFWASGDFQVFDGERLVGRCAAGQSVCDLRP